MPLPIGETVKKGPSAELQSSGESICRLLADLLGRSVIGKKMPPFPLTPIGRRIVIAFEEDDGSIRFVLVCDTAFAAFAGAALLMVPAQIAKECVSAGQCTPELLDNLAEILNICRQCFDRPGHHIAPPQLYGAGRAAAAGVMSLIAAPKQRLDLEVKISGYGDGRLSILI